ncbi:uncharacterized protein ARMOST_21096 [Armillaria ostoyae]|uniref:Uncharacterized protein n=1 Tax=Armillaria ostoyae TaxID=47428 RepID=A0A284S965_ARMOS|nr:uncharacterized protein ARMOST_21096 [Armillaria ostoyae]
MTGAAVDYLTLLLGAVITGQIAVVTRLKFNSSMNPGKHGRSNHSINCPSMSASDSLRLELSHPAPAKSMSTEPNAPCSLCAKTAWNTHTHTHPSTGSIPAMTSLHKMQGREIDDILQSALNTSFPIYSYPRSQPHADRKYSTRNTLTWNHVAPYI